MKIIKNARNLIFRAIVAGVFSGLLAGCNTFNRDWETVVHQPIQTNSIEGPWQGMWRSEANGHNGKLRCLVTKKDNNSYRARFHAQYGKLLSFSYAVSLKAQQETNGFNFRGQANLGLLAGGVYYYEGHADQTNYFSTYSCKYDHGTFQMTRP